MKQNKNKGESKWIGTPRQKQRGKQTDMKQGRHEGSTHMKSSNFPMAIQMQRRVILVVYSPAAAMMAPVSKQLNVYLNGNFNNRTSH